MATLRLFAAAREAAGTGRAVIRAPTVGSALDEARVRYGAEFSKILATSRVWLNGQPAPEDTPIGEEDEVAVLPPVSGG